MSCALFSARGFRKRFGVDEAAGLMDDFFTTGDLGGDDFDWGFKTDCSVFLFGSVN